MTKQLAKAPALYHEGKSTDDITGSGFGMISHDLFRAIMEQTTGQDGALRSVILYFLLQKGDGAFRVPEEIVLKNCNINHSTYSRVKNKLVSMGWITCVSKESITVHINRILKMYHGDT